MSLWAYGHNDWGGRRGGVWASTRLRGAGMAFAIDYIVRSSRVFTSDSGEVASRPRAFAVAGNRIAYVGSFEDVVAACPAHTPVRDFGDALVCPGFHDAHLHFFHTALGNSPYLLMHRGTSEAELVARTRAFAEGLPAHAWVVTQGWRDYRWIRRCHPPSARWTWRFPTVPA